MLNFPLSTGEERKRFFELLGIILISIALVALSRLEGNLFDLSKQLSEHQDFLTSVVYFGLINVNVVLVLVLSFLIFRNVVKLVLERRRGVIGSKLRSKLVIALVFFALAPTALLFYISSRFLTESFDTWFSAKVESTMHRTREAGALVYERDKRRIEGLARIALQRIQIKDSAPFQEKGLISAGRLKGFDQEYRVFAVQVFDARGHIVWNSLTRKDDEEVSSQAKSFVLGALERFRTYPGMTSKAVVDVDNGRDVVRGVAPIIATDASTIIGVVMTEERFDTQILKSIEGIIQEFANLRPGAELIRLSYLILLVLMAFIILFSATWFGFYVSRAIMAPIQSLAEATKEVALGNYSVNLTAKADDETGQLIRSFNSMTADLQAHEQQVKEFTDKLEQTNIELDQRRKYMEVVLRNISAGVISVSPKGEITSFNRAAEKLLKIRAEDAIGVHSKDAFDTELLENFWEPIIARVDLSGEFSGQVDLNFGSKDLTILADAIRIADEAGEDLGAVVVFDDASEQVKVQRVAAWREVARRIAHEIKNPITPIKLSAQRLLRRFGGEFTGKDHQVFTSCVETIVSEVDGLRDLVNEFSKFARMPSVQTELGDVCLLIRDVVSMYSLSYQSVNFNLDGLEGEYPLIQIDKEQMIRVFTNLITNSVDALEGEGSISLNATLVDHLKIIRISLSDDGPGIPEKLRQKVLEPYFSTKAHGTGLGLAIVSKIISDHGGYLRIQDSSNQGTTVIVELPLV